MAPVGHTLLVTYLEHRADSTVLMGQSNPTTEPVSLHSWKSNWGKDFSSL